MSAPAAYGLSPREKGALDAIRAHIARTGSSPSYDEIAAAIGVRGKSRVHQLVTALEARGRIRRLPRLKRSIALVDADGADARACLALLPADTAAALLLHCRRHNDNPAHVIADAVTLYLDQADASGAAS